MRMMQKVLLLPQQWFVPTCMTCAPCMAGNA